MNIKQQHREETHGTCLYVPLRRFVILFALFCFVLTSTPARAAEQKYEGFAVGIKNMADRLSAGMIQQMFILGTFFDAKEQLEIQTTFQELEAIAHKDYHPSDQMCRFGSFVRSIAHTEAKATLDKRALSRILNARMLNTKDSSSSQGFKMDFDARLDQFKTVYCDPKDNAGTLEDFCKHEDGSGGDDPARFNKDIDYTRTINNQLTLDIDFTKQNTIEDEIADEEDVIALAKNLYWPEVFVFAGGLKKGKFSSFKKYLDARSLMAMQNVAQNSYVNIVSMKGQSPAPDSPDEQSGGAFMKSMMLEFGMEPDDIHEYLGDRPSYDAQMEVLSKKIYQSPDFYTNLYDKPVNVDRIGVSMQAIGLMNGRDHYNALLRREMLLSLLVEQALFKDQVKVSAELSSAAAAQPLKNY